jgi:hypothetical protein
MEGCCSEDETDQSDAMSIDSDSECESDVMDIDNSASSSRCSSPPKSKKAIFSNSKPKYCIVRQFAWRNPAVNDLMELLDEWRREKRQSTPKKPRGPIPAIRKRPTSPVISDTKASPGLPYDFYDPEWLNSLNDVEMSSLEVSLKPGLEFYTSVLQKYRRRQQ